MASTLRNAFSQLRCFIRPCQRSQSQIAEIEFWRSSMTTTVRAIEFYSGIGGLHRALDRSAVNSTVVRAFDWDQTACRVYDENYGPGLVQKIDIATLDESTFMALDAPLWLLSPSCQPYTVLNPASRGAADPRAKSFLHLIHHVLPRLVSLGRAPSWILVENVAGFETSTTRQSLLQELNLLKFNVLELLLTPLQYGIPNSRLRYYLLAKLMPRKFAHVSQDRHGHVWRHIPVDVKAQNDHISSESVQPDSQFVTPLFQYLDSFLTNEQDCESEAAYRIPDRVLDKWGRLFDIVLPSSRRTCCFTRGYTQMVEGSGSVLQMNEDLDTTETFDKFLEARRRTETNSRNIDFAETPLNANSVSILRPLCLRFFTPSELLRLLHFTTPKISHSVDHKDSGRDWNEFRWPQDISRKSKYRLLGNSINVEVVSRLIDYLFEGDDLP